ncbi:hypothetical protein AWB81_01773 [Caballeronia arationis]|uniref:hypothetical protein n=1 Tax=Caballeronia arationis TaxID=1777142 RepID=UPI00074C2EC5|nr:hypothetical protein [Caballeronia arationis]SAK58964.1 hypothetical protein AWB81_01773 [Caballeronia arationis]
MAQAPYLIAHGASSSHSHDFDLTDEYGRPSGARYVLGTYVRHRNAPEDFSNEELCEKHYEGLCDDSELGRWYTVWFWSTRNGHGFGPRRPMQHFRTREQRYAYCMAELDRMRKRNVYDFARAARPAAAASAGSPTTMQTAPLK